MNERSFHKYQKYNNINITEENFNNHNKYKEEYKELKKEFITKVAKLQQNYNVEDIFLDHNFYRWENKIQAKAMGCLWLGVMLLSPCITLIWIPIPNLNITRLCVFVLIGIFFLYKSIKNFIISFK